MDQEAFHAMHRRLLGAVFEVHNEFGRYLDELLFKRTIASRCEEVGLVPAECEVRIRVHHDTFHKDYFVDLLLGHGLLLETKAAEQIAPAHRAQALNYLLLLGLHHGALINLRGGRVQHEFVSTQLTPEVRRQFRIVDTGWRDTGEKSVWIKDKLAALLRDWGAFLEIALYREALTHFLGGPDAVI